MKNIQLVSDSYLCSNCGACSAICNKNAIDFKWSSVGRLYASINENCTNCGNCLKVCPSLDYHQLHATFSDKYIGVIKNVYIGKSTNRQCFLNAQSGGVVTGILLYLFEQKQIDAAIVCQMECGRIPLVNPVIISDKYQLFNTQKSCYTPVPLLKILKEIKDYKSVAIVGLPCHLEGVAELQKTTQRFDNIKFKVGLICDRTECNGIQEIIKDYTGFESFKINWRQKYDKQNDKYNYQEAPIVAVSDKGEEKVLLRHYRMALKDMFTPPRCRVCWDKLNVFADITCGDPWRLPDIDKENGESLIIVRSLLGQSVVDAMSVNGDLMRRTIDNNAPHRSQLIEERRSLVFAYSKAFSCMPTSISSYLLSQNQDSEVDCSVQVDTLKDFIELEKMSYRQIISEAHKNIALHEAKMKKRQSLCYRLKRRISKCIKWYENRFIRCRNK